MNYTENIKTENKKKKTKERNFYEVKDFKRKRKNPPRNYKKKLVCGLTKFRLSFHLN